MSFRSHDASLTEERAPTELRSSGGVPGHGDITVLIAIVDGVAREAVTSIVGKAGYGMASDSGHASVVITDRVPKSAVNHTVLVTEPVPLLADEAIAAVWDGRAHGVVLTSHLLDLAAVVEGVLGGHTMMSRDVLALAHRLPSMTDRQRRVLLHVVAGFNNRQIALRERVSVATVKRDLGRLLEGHGCGSRFELVRSVYELGFAGPLHRPRP